MNLIPVAWAQVAGAAGPGAGQQPFALPLMMVAFVAIFYFLLIRPQQKQLKEHQALLSKLAEGDEVVTSGGILGKITEVGETFVTIEVADGVRIKVQKSKIGGLMPKGTLRKGS